VDKHLHRVFVAEFTIKVPHDDPQPRYISWYVHEPMCVVHISSLVLSLHKLQHPVCVQALLLHYFSQR